MKRSPARRAIDILDRIGRCDVVVASTAMFAIAAITVWGVFTRYVLVRPTAWVEELSLGLFVWLTFFGTSILARRGEIIAIEFLLQLFPKRLSFVIKKILTTALLTATIGFIIVFGFRLAALSTQRFTAILRIPFSVIYAGMPIGAIFTLYHVLRCAVAGPRFYEDDDQQGTVHP